VEDRRQKTEDGRRKTEDKRNKNQVIMTEIWAIILAAGESKRMGSPKMLMQFKGRTIIENVIENVTNSKVDKTMVVLGGSGEEIMKILGEAPVQTCFNSNYKQGMLSSVKCGLQHLPAIKGAVVIFLGDQPMIGSAIINIVIEAYRKEGKGIVMPVFDNKRGHPLLIDLKYRNEILNIKTEEGLHSLARKFTDDVLEVKVDTAVILKDIDTKEDYINELKNIS
jgi:molybdenum cofactor cytidylyltransferase